YVLIPNPKFSASSTIVLNLSILKTLPFFPNLSCLNNTGPFESSFIVIAIINRIGDKIIIPIVEQDKSIILLMSLSIMFMLFQSFITFIILSNSNYVIFKSNRKHKPLSNKLFSLLYHSF